MKVITKHPLRSIFVAPKGKQFVSVDLSQAETWIVAFLAGEERMKKALMFGDIHCQTTALAVFPKILGEEYNDKKHVYWSSSEGKLRRYIGKRVNHATSYGMGYFRFTEVVNADSIDTGVVISNSQSKTYIENWHRYYFNIRPWHQSISNQLVTSGRILTTPYGRRRRFYTAHTEHLHKEALAFIPQSTVADHAFGCIQREVNKSGGILGIYNNFIDGSNNKNNDISIINTSHDSVMLEVPKNSARDIGLEVKSLMMRPLMVNGETFTIPADLEIGERWGELEKVA